MKCVWRETRGWAFPSCFGSIWIIQFLIYSKAIILNNGNYLFKKKALLLATFSAVHEKKNGFKVAKHNVSYYNTVVKYITSTHRFQFTPDQKVLGKRCCQFNCDSIGCRMLSTSRFPYAQTQEEFMTCDTYTSTAPLLRSATTTVISWKRCRASYSHVCTSDPHLSSADPPPPNRTRIKGKSTKA